LVVPEARKLAAREAVLAGQCGPNSRCVSRSPPGRP